MNTLQVNTEVHTFHQNTSQHAGASQNENKPQAAHANAFQQFHLSQQLLAAIQRMGYKEPTQIQVNAIPPILAGKDVVGESATGSGKTLAFGCGVIERTVPNAGLQALIITPTRELAEQVKDSLCQISFQKQLRIISVYGGVGMEPQIHGLRQANIVVATPGRLNDHLQRRTIDLLKVNVLVLDEADRMLDMGFIEDIERIMSACRNRKQTLFFSATFPPQIVRLTTKYMNNPIRVQARRHVDPTKMEQVYYNVPTNMKLSLLVHLMKSEPFSLIMVFCNTRRTTDFVVKNLRTNGIDAIAIHGGFAQNKRTKTIQQFKEGNQVVLVCTDVAARGLHIDNVSHVYNYEIPKDPDDYVHRIGRTARAGEEGKVVNLLSEADYDQFGRLQNSRHAFTIRRVDAPQVDRVRVLQTDQGRRGGFGGGNRRFGMQNNRGRFKHRSWRR